MIPRPTPYSDFGCQKIMYCALVQMNMKYESQLTAYLSVGVGEAGSCWCWLLLMWAVRPFQSDWARTADPPRPPPAPGIHRARARRWGGGQQEFQVWCRGGDGEMLHNHNLVIIYTLSTHCDRGGPIVHTTVSFPTTPTVSCRLC